MRADRLLIGLLGRLEVTGDVDEALRDGPLLLAANHIGNIDALVVLAACHDRRIPLRYLATGGLFDAPVLGAVLRRTGHIRVDRGGSTATAALRRVVGALERDHRPVLVYPEGRIGLEPGGWPERGKTGVARMALSGDIPVVPVSQWGAHELLCYGRPLTESRRNLLPMLASLLRTVRRRPVLRVHFGKPVDLSGLAAQQPGDAARARDRIMRAVTEGLVELRRDEPDVPAHRDPTRPVTDRRSPWRP